MELEESSERLILGPHTLIKAFSSDVCQYAYCSNLRNMYRHRVKMESSPSDPLHHESSSDVIFCISHTHSCVPLFMLFLLPGVSSFHFVWLGCIALISVSQVSIRTFSISQVSKWENNLVNVWLNGRLCDLCHGKSWIIKTLSNTQ